VGVTCLCVADCQLPFPPSQHFILSVAVHAVDHAKLTTTRYLLTFFRPSTNWRTAFRVWVGEEAARTQAPQLPTFFHGSTKVRTDRVVAAVLASRQAKGLIAQQGNGLGFHFPDVPWCGFAGVEIQFVIHGTRGEERTLAPSLFGYNSGETVWRLFLSKGF